MTFDEMEVQAWKRVEDICNEPCGGEVPALRQLERVRELACAVATGNAKRLEDLLGLNNQTYILHATVDYTVQQKETGETESGTQRPTLSVEAPSEEAAIEKAEKEREEAIGTDWWPVVSLSLRVDLVTVV